MSDMFLAQGCITTPQTSLYAVKALNSNMSRFLTLSPFTDLCIAKTQQPSGSRTDLYLPVH